MTFQGSKEEYRIPRILLAKADGELRRSIAALLGKDGYGLEAHDQPSTLHVIKTHSRLIDLLVIAEDMDEGKFANLLVCHRAGMRVTSIPRHLPDGDVPEKVVATIRKLLATCRPKSNQGHYELEKPKCKVSAN